MKRTMPKPGDIYLTKLPDGRYTAVRVIRTIGKSSLVATTEFLGGDRPTLDDPLVRTTVIQNRFFYRGQAARTWLEGRPPTEVEYLGNIPLMKAETDTECNVYGGKWDKRSCFEAYFEWRWLHDRSAFEEEVRRDAEERERRRRLPQKPKKMMNEAEFWSIIELLDWTSQGNDEKVLAPAVKALASKSKSVIQEFEERLAFLLYQIDTKEHASKIGESSYDPESNYVSADGFLYARCVVVANGKEYYDSVLKNPINMPKDMEFESLLGLASAAYKLKTGDEFEYSTGCSYESFSNPSGWNRD